MEKEVNRWKKFGEGLLSVGIGGLLAYYFIEMTNLKLLPFSPQIEDMVVSGNMQNLSVGIMETFILMVSVFALFAAPLFICRDEKAGIKILVLLLFIFIDIAGVAIVIIRREIFFLYIVAVWVSSIYAAWFLIDVLHILYSWVKTDVADVKFDMAKLTFIWTVIAFIIGKVW